MRFFHAILNRAAYVRWALLGLVGLVPLIAQAGYTSVVPPTPIQGGPGAYTAKRSADLAIEKARNSSNAYAKGIGKIPGMPGAKIPFMARVSALAPANAARFMFGGPLGLGITALGFLAGECLEYGDSGWHVTCGDTSYPVSTGSEYFYIYQGREFLNPSLETCIELNAWQRNWIPNVTYLSHTSTTCTYKYGSPATLTGTTSFSSRATQCPAGWYITPAGCVATPPPVQINEEDFVTKVAPKISPEKIPDYLPDWPIPIDDPMVLPDNDADEDSATPRPLYIPEGEPQAIPNTDPQQYKQPFTRVVPAPTSTDPWRVDLQPVERTSSSPTPVSDPTQDPNQTSSGSTAQAEQLDLCKEHPDILACAKPELDVPEGQIPRDQVNISYTPESFLGGGGSCPPPTDIHFFGHTARVFDTAQACGWVTSYMKPILLALCAWLSLSIVMGGLGAIKE